MFLKYMEKFCLACMVSKWKLEFTEYKITIIIAVSLFTALQSLLLELHMTDLCLKKYWKISELLHSAISTVFKC